MFVRTLGKAPWPFRWLLAQIVSFMLIYTPNNAKQITRKNIDLACAHLSKSERNSLIVASLRNLGFKTFDFLSTWFATEKIIQNSIIEVVGLDEFQKARQIGPTLILLPHLGNWEIFGLWLSKKFPYTAMFRPLRIPALTNLVRQARERGGNRLVEANRSGIRQLLKDLRKGGLVIVLPDQNPKNGHGEYIPFFGIPTLTPTLPYRLAQSTKAAVFIATAIKESAVYRIEFQKLEADLSNRNQWLVEMNLLVESFVRKHPSQYQWEYRRFRNAPDGSLRYP